MQLVKPTSEIVEDIKAAAKEAGLRMYQVRAKAGIGPATWHRWINGQSEPKVETLRRIEDVFNSLESQPNEGEGE